MDITELRNMTAAIHASMEVSEDNEFKNSPLNKYIDNQLYNAAALGKNNVCLNFYAIKECLFGDEYDGPTLDTVIRNYRNEGFVAFSDISWSLNGGWFRALIISWK